MCPRCHERLLPVEAAGFWPRAAAALIDGALLATSAGMLTLVMLWLGRARPLYEGSWGLDAILQVMAASPGSLLAHAAPFLAMATLYFTLFWGLLGRTPGQKRMRLRVIDATGHFPAWYRAVARTVGLFLAALPCALGMLWAAFDTERRALHDHLSGTYVVNDR